MLKIGEFAALAQISVRMLRHYDELGLLKPAHVDRESEYRYYTLEQLPRLNRILALKDLGLALGEIRLLLDEALSADEIRGMMKLKQAQLQRHITEEQARLRRVECRLSHIEQEGQLPDVEVVIKSQASLHVISLIGEVSPQRQVPTVFRDAYSVLKQHNLTQHTQGIMTIYPRSMEFYQTRKRPCAPDYVEAAYMVHDNVQQSLRMPDDRELRVWDVPAYPQVASVVTSRPDFERHLDAQLLWQWIFEHNYRLIAPVREIHLKRPTTSDGYLTEMLFPIEPILQEE